MFWIGLGFGAVLGFGLCAFLVWLVTPLEVTDEKGNRIRYAGD